MLGVLSYNLQTVRLNLLKSIVETKISQIYLVTTIINVLWERVEWDKQDTKDWILENDPIEGQKEEKSED